MRVLASRPVRETQKENWNQGAMLKDWERPVSDPSLYRDPVSLIEVFLLDQPEGISLSAPGINLIRLKLAASCLNDKLGYLAYSIGKDRITRRKRQ